MRGSSEPFRHNLIELAVNGEWTDIPLCHSKIRLFNAGHMLGSCMVSVREFQNRYIYTSDFGWPLPKDDLALLKNSSHDVLVIDASYGHPERSRRFYSQQQVRDALLEIVSREIRTKKIKIIGTRGRLQRAYQTLEAELDKMDIMFSGSPLVDKTIDIYHKGLSGMSGEHYSFNAVDSRIQLIDTRDQPVIEAQGDNEITIRLRETRSQDHYITKTDKDYQISMTDHADFGGTIAMIELIKPKGGILTVGTYALELANYAREEMGYEACCAVMRKSAA